MKEAVRTVKLEAEVPGTSSYIQAIKELLMTGKTLEVNLFDYNRKGEKKLKLSFTARLS